MLACTLPESSFAQFFQRNLKQTFIFLNIYILMKQNKEARFKTINLNQLETPTRRLKTGCSNPHKLEKVNNSDKEKCQVFCKTTSKDFPGSPTSFFSNRESGRLNLLAFKNKDGQKSHLETFKSQVKAGLQKLSLKQKIFQIQSVLRNTRELCRNYGYFSVTFAMLKFNFSQQIKISVWIHPDPRSVKPLHPIKKQTNFQCELACVSQLKSILKALFPNVDLGDGKTFGTIFAHFDNMKTEIDSKQRKNIASQKQTPKVNGFPKNKSDKFKTGLAASSKTIPTFCCIKPQEDVGDQMNRKIFKTEFKNKQTTSTLVQSIKSGNSMKEKIKLQTPVLEKGKKQEKPNLEIKKHRKQKQRKPSFSQPPKDNVPSEESKDGDMNKVGQNKQSQEKSTGRQSQPHMYISQNKSGLKASNIRRFMTMSIEIESEINNLFENDEMKVSNFYTGNKNVKNTQLTKVAQQFEDLF